MKSSLNFSSNALIVLQKRYLKKNSSGEVVETPQELLRRVACAIASVEKEYGANEEKYKKVEKDFFEMMKELEFMPNSPTLMNAGKELGQLSACFTKEQKILSNPGYKNIDQIKIGDKVVTAQGRTKKVVELHQRKYKGQLYTLDIQGLMKPSLSVTEEHPVLAVKKGNVVCRRIKNNKCNGFIKKHCLKMSRQYKENCEFIGRFFEPEWTPIKRLEKDDFVVVNTNREIKGIKEIKIKDHLKNNIYLERGNSLVVRGRPNEGKEIPNKIKIDNDFLRLIGYWLADGSLSKRYDKYGVIRFTFNLKEKEFCKEVRRIMKEKFNLTAKEEFTEKQKTIQIRFNSIIVAELFHELFGKGFNGKKLPAWVITLPLERQFNLIVGLFRGDGCYSKKKKQDRIFVSLSNEKLANDVWNILLRLKYNFNITHRKPKGATKEAYRIGAAPSECKQLVEAVKKGEYKERKIFPRYIKAGDMMLRPISRIESKPFEGDVYNLEVEQDHSYLANGVAVHNCFVIPVLDSMESIFDAIKSTALIHQSGGGTGFSFSRLRPKNSIVRSTGGVASGPVSFMKVFDSATQAVKQGGARRGANMGILRVDHPDILEFIKCKEKEGEISNFNISVALTDDFMEKVLKKEKYQLRDPHTGKVTGELDAKEVFDLIAGYAYKNGEPGVIFIDRMNKHNPTPALGNYESTNPCVSADTWIMTKKGPRKAGELLGQKFTAIVDGKEYKSTDKGFFKTGVKPVYKLKTKEGFEIRATLDHPFLRVVYKTRDVIKTEWAALDSLKAGDKVLLNNHTSLKGWEGDFSFNEGYLAGLVLGDGTIKKEGWVEVESQAYARDGTLNRFAAGESGSRVKGRDEYRLSTASLKGICSNAGFKVRSKKITDLAQKASLEFCKGLLRGLFDTDGSVQGTQEKGVSIRLSQSDLELLKDAQKILLRLGIFSKIYAYRRQEGMKSLPDGKGSYKEYPIKAQHELIISGVNILEFSKKIGFKNSQKRKRLEENLQNYKRELNKEDFLGTVENLEFEGMKEVYDVQIPGINAFDANGFKVHNCGEQVLLPYESCNLGSINLSKMIKETEEGFEINWQRLKKVTRQSVRFLDNVIDANKFPLDQIKENTLKTRKVGLGVMGWATMLGFLGIAYDTEEAIELAKKVMRFIRDTAYDMSRELAGERGTFPSWEASSWQKQGIKIRNATLTTIAPTGTISIIAGPASSGVEPNFSLCYFRNVLDGEKLLEADPAFEYVAKKEGFYSQELMKKAASGESIQKMKEVPEEVKRVFKTAMDISPFWHIKMQGAFQEYTDNAVSKTINLPNSAKVNDIKEAYLLAYRVNCKGVTVYRDGSRKIQVLTMDKKKEDKEGADSIESKEAESYSLVIPYPKPRPEVILGTTTKVTTGCGNLYITVNQDEAGNFFEIFTQMGKAGGCAASQLEAVGRLVSLALRGGIDVKVIVEQIKGIRCPCPSWDKGKKIFSCADAIGRVLEKRAVDQRGKVKIGVLSSKKEEPKKAMAAVAANKNNSNNVVGVCIECGFALRHQEGCLVCDACGYSKC